jgi:hypothetical protein
MRNNKTGVLGVCEAGDKFHAQIGAKGERYSLGYFNTIEEAAHAYATAKAEMHTAE